MMEKMLKAACVGVGFALVSAILLSLVVTSLLYFEVAGIVLMQKVMYVSFVMISFVVAFIASRIVRVRGLLVGLSVASVFIVFGLLYHMIGVEQSIGASFLIRSLVSLVVCLAGSVIGVNTVKS